jgi:phenylacetate-CoA ligase
MYGALYRHVLLPLFDGVIKRRRTLEYWRQAEASQWWPRERLEAFQWEALLRLLQHAAATCPYYRETWAARKLSPERLERWSDFLAWPLITRETIRQQRLAMRTTLNLPRLAKATGGSSGEPLQFDLDWGSNDRRTAMMYRGYGWAGGAPGSKQLYVWGGHVGQVPAWKRWKAALHRRFERQIVLNCFDFTPQRMQRHLERWNRYRPEVVVGYTNPLCELARYVRASGRQVAAPRSIIVGAEKLHDFQRQLLQEVFQAPVFETYGSREFMLIGAECERHCGLHLSVENLYVEIVDDEGLPVPEGTEGNVVITDLFNYGMPFVRYVTGDRAIAGFENCPCGRGLPLLKKVVGRQLDVLETPDGRKVPGEFFPHLLKEFPCVRRFQVVQTAADRITLKLVVEGGFTLADHDLLLREIRNCVGTAVEVAFELVDDIPLTPAGKHRVVVREIPPRSAEAVAHTNHELQAARSG